VAGNFSLLHRIRTSSVAPLNLVAIGY